MVVNASNDGSNSMFVNIDGEPANPGMIWDIPVTQGFEERTVSWRGNGTPDSPQFVTKTFNLSAGQHELIIRGREQQTLADKVEVVFFDDLPPGQIKKLFIPYVVR